MLTFLLAMVLVVLGGLLLGAVAAIVAIGLGLPPARAFELVADPSASPLVTSPIWLCASILMNEALLAFLLWRFLKRHHLFFREVCPLRMPSLRDVAGALACVFGLMPLSELAAEVARRGSEREVTAEALLVALSRGLSPFELALVLVAAALIPAVIEESMFRGLLTRAFSYRGHALALVVPSVLFALFHVEPTQAAGTLVLGIGFGIARLYTDSVLTSMLCHFVYNAYVILAVHAGAQVGDPEYHFGRVGLGLGVAALGFGLIVFHPGERRHLRS